MTIRLHFGESRRPEPLEYPVGRSVTDVAMTLRLQRLSAVLMVRVWPIVIVCDLVVTAFVARPIALAQQWIDATYDVMALAATVLNIGTFIRPSSPHLSAVAVGAAVTALAGRGSWLMFAWERPLAARIGAAATYMTLAVAEMIAGVAAATFAQAKRR